MADFIQLPVVDTISVNSSVNGKPFTDTAYKVATTCYAGTDNGTVYMARVNNSLYFVSIGYGYYGYTWLLNTNYTVKWEVAKTDWLSIYCVESIGINGEWTANLTAFDNADTMLESFYDTIVFPHVTPLDGDIIVIMNPSIPHLDTIEVNLPVIIPNAETILVSASPSTIDTNDSGGTSESGGGHGTFDDTSDKIPIPSLPIISATNSGLITLFRPNLNKLQQLGAYLWTNLTDFIDNLNKIFTNPMDYMIALNIFPCLPPVDAERPIKIGSFTTTIYMPPVTSQWYEHDCGTIRINEYWGSALDYSPNTKISAFLPFIGSVQLNTDEVMNRTIGLRYRIDLLSGQCVAMITVDGTVYYQFTGECAVPVPLTGSDWSRTYAAVVGAIGTAITAGVAAGGIGLVNQTAGSMIAANSYNAAAQAGASWAALGAQGAARGTRGVVAMREQMNAAAQGAIENARNAAQGATRRANGLAAARLLGGASNAVNEVMNGKGGITHSGSISGSAGMLGVKQPYVLIEFPNQSLAENYKHYVGYPSNMEFTLGNLSGYTECEQVVIGIPGTDDELAELQEALKGGVYL